MGSFGIGRWGHALLLAVGLLLIAWATIRFYRYLGWSPTGIGFDFYYYAVQARELATNGRLYYPTPFVLVFLLDAAATLVVSDPVVAVRLVSAVLVCAAGFLAGLIAWEVLRVRSIAVCCACVTLLSPSLSHFTVEYRKTLVALVLVLAGYYWGVRSPKVSFGQCVAFGTVLLLAHGLSVLVVLWLVASSARVSQLWRGALARRWGPTIVILLTTTVTVALALWRGTRLSGLQGQAGLEVGYVVVVCALHARAVYSIVVAQPRHDFLHTLAVAISVTTIASALLALVNLDRYTNHVVDRIVLFAGVAQLLPLLFVLRDSGWAFRWGLIVLSSILILWSPPVGISMADNYSQLNDGATELVLPERSVVIAPQGFNFWITYRYRIRSAKEIENPESYDIFVWMETSVLPCMVWSGSPVPIPYRNRKWAIIALSDYRRCLDG